MPTTKIKNLLYQIALPFCAPACGKDPVSTTEGHQLINRDSFMRLIRRHHVLGSATMISDGNDHSVICTRSERPRHDASKDTFFRVASITKTATAALIMRLCDLQMIDPDRPVNAYLPFHDRCPALSRITLRHLLSHTSGITDPPDLEMSLVSGIPFPDIIDKAVYTEPGKAFHYSNLGFGLIGCILEAVISKPIGTVFDEYLFAPLGMNATIEGCLLPSAMIMPVTRVLPYNPGKDLILTDLGSVPLLEPDPLRHYGHTAGSMYTDIMSLRRLLLVLISDEKGFLSEKSRADMKKEYASYGRLSPTLSYGLGLLRIKDPGLSGNMIYGHQGFAYGCADGAFWEEKTNRIMIMLNGGCSEARKGRLGMANHDFLHWAFAEELPKW